MIRSDQPLVSVIIPTRERADTLPFAIETALDQAIDEYEVIVSDNCSQDNTKEVVDRFKDPRLVYLNTGRRMSMSDNWDFALKRANGTYVIFIGDDDAVMPGALGKLAALIRTDPNPSLVYTWPLHIYRWPMNGQGASAEFGVCMNSNAREIDLTIIPRTVVRMGGRKFDQIPMVYHSAIAKEILDSVRRQTGRVFHSTQPDVFSGLAIPAFTNRAINVGYSVTLAGHSPKSNGGARFTRNHANVKDQFVREFDGYRIHPTLFPDIPLLANLIPDAVLVAMDKFPQFYGRMKFNYSAMWAVICKLGPVMNYNLSHYEIILKCQEIRHFHPFNVTVFLLYAAFYEATAWRRKFLRQRQKISSSLVPIPENIRDFVKQLAHLQENSRPFFSN